MNTAEILIILIPMIVTGFIIACVKTALSVREKHVEAVRKMNDVMEDFEMAQAQKKAMDKMLPPPAPVSPFRTLAEVRRKQDELGSFPFHPTIPKPQTTYNRPQSVVPKNKHTVVYNTNVIQNNIIVPAAHRYETDSLVDNVIDAHAAANVVEDLLNDSSEKSYDDMNKAVTVEPSVFESAVESTYDTLSSAYDSVADTVSSTYESISDSFSSSSDDSGGSFFGDD